MEKDIAKVFISYSSANEDFAELVKMKLEEVGFSIWKDTNQLMAGDEWRNVIDTALLDANVILVLLDENSANSPYVTYEWAFALGSGKIIIPLLVEDCKIHPRISVFQYLDFKNQKRPWDKLIDLIKSKQSSQKDTIRVSDLTIEEFETILARSKALINAKSKTGTDDVKIETMVNKLSKAKSNYHDFLEKTHTILWVDDRPNNNIFERQALETVGFSFELAKSTKEALSLFSEGKYVAIISDMGRVEGAREGYALLREIRKQDRQIPFFIYSSDGHLPAHKLEAQEKGAQGSTSGPDRLIDLVLSHIEPKHLD